jgi:putative phosphoribosyl transferase
MLTTFTPYRDRIEAGQALGHRLQAWASRSDTIVLGLPRGGVPVAAEVARILDAPLDVFLVRKLSLPAAPGQALGAVASGGVELWNEEAMRAGCPDSHEVVALVARETAELRRREKLYRGERPLPDLQDRVVLLVDDGIATGETMRAAIAAVGARQPARLIVAAPVGAAEACHSLARSVNAVVCPLTPEPFYAVGCWYDRYAEVADEAMREMLDQAEARVSERGRMRR